MSQAALLENILDNAINNNKPSSNPVSKPKKPSNNGNNNGNANANGNRNKTKYNSNSNGNAYNNGNVNGNSNGNINGGNGYNNNSNGYYDEVGHQYWIDNQGYRYYKDNSGYPCYKDEHGYMYYIDQNGHPYYPDEWWADFNYWTQQQQNYANQYPNNNHNKYNTTHNISDNDESKASQPLNNNGYKKPDKSFALYQGMVYGNNQPAIKQQKPQTKYVPEIPKYKPKIIKQTPKPKVNKFKIEPLLPKGDDISQLTRWTQEIIDRIADRDVMINSLITTLRNKDAAKFEKAKEVVINKWSALLCDIMDELNSKKKNTKFLHDILLYQHRSNIIYKNTNMFEDAKKYRDKYAKNLIKLDYNKHKGLPNELYNKNCYNKNITNFIQLIQNCSSESFCIQSFEHWVNKTSKLLDDNGIKIRDSSGPLTKDLLRAFFKCLYLYDISDGYKYVTDMLRCYFVFNNFESLYNAYNIISKNNRILRVKDRFCQGNDIPFGYRDLMFNIYCPNSGIICEIQLHHESLFNACYKGMFNLHQKSRIFKKINGNIAYEYAKKYIKINQKRLDDEEKQLQYKYRKNFKIIKKAYGTPLTLDEVTQDRNGFSTFCEHLICEYAIENILFAIEAEQIKIHARKKFDNIINQKSIELRMKELVLSSSLPESPDLKKFSDSIKLRFCYLYHKYVAGDNAEMLVNIGGNNKKRLTKLYNKFYQNTYCDDNDLMNFNADNNSNNNKPKKIDKKEQERRILHLKAEMKRFEQGQYAELPFFYSDGFEDTQEIVDCLDKSLKDILANLRDSLHRFAVTPQGIDFTTKRRETKPKVGDKPANGKRREDPNKKIDAILKKNESKVNEILFGRNNKPSN